MKRLVIASLCLIMAWPVVAAPSLRLIGTYEAPQTIDGNNAFGGISGIDYDPRRGLWAMISDDRSEHAPARLYWGRLDYDDKSVTGLSHITTVTLHREDGSAFPRFGEGGEGADGESLRVDPKTDQVLWSSEGDYQDGFDPHLRRVDDRGDVISEVPLPAFMHFDKSGTRGPRDNLTTEGLSYSHDGRTLWVSVEAPLIEDGAPPSTARGALTRILHLRRDGHLLNIYAYPLDAIGHQLPGLHADNGISEILLADRNHLLVLERAGEEYAPKRYRFHCRLYEVDLAGAKAVGASALGDATPLHKTLVVDFDAVGLDRVDNLEGMSFGPRLPNGHRSLVVVSDDNFSPVQVNQFLVFDVSE